MPGLEYCSAMWCSAADTHLKLLDRVVSGTRFLTGDVFECDIAHRRSVAVRSICCIRSGVIRCTLFMVLYIGRMCQWCSKKALGALVAHRFTYSIHGCKTRTFAPISVSLWNDFADPVFDGVGLADFKSRSNAL